MDQIQKSDIRNQIKKNEIILIGRRYKFRAIFAYFAQLCAVIFSGIIGELSKNQIGAYLLVTAFILSINIYIGTHIAYRPLVIYDSPTIMGWYILNGISWRSSSFIVLVSHNPMAHLSSTFATISVCAVSLLFIRRSNKFHLVSSTTAICINSASLLISAHYFDLGIILPNIAYISTYYYFAMVEYPIMIKREMKELLRIKIDDEKIKLQADRSNAVSEKYLELTSVAHDIKAPINILKSMSAANRHIESEFSNVVFRRALDHLDYMINGVIQLIQINEKLMLPSSEWVDINYLLISVAEEASIRHAGVKLKIKSIDAIVQTDEIILKRILTNVLDNAVLHGKARCIMLTSRMMMKTLVIRIFDGGVGLDRSILNSSYDPFRRSEDGRSESSGLGLGMYIIHKLSVYVGHELKFMSSRGRGLLVKINVSGECEIQSSDFSWREIGGERLQLPSAKFSEG